MYKVTERKITKSDLEEDGTNEGREAHLKLLGQIDFTGIYFIFFPAMLCTEYFGSRL